jgi:hypothetical protein
MRAWRRNPDVGRGSWWGPVCAAGALDTARFPRGGKQDMFRLPTPATHIKMTDLAKANDSGVDSLEIVQGSRIDLSAEGWHRQRQPDAGRSPRGHCRNGRGVGGFWRLTKPGCGTADWFGATCKSKPVARAEMESRLRYPSAAPIARSGGRGTGSVAAGYTQITRRPDGLLAGK